MKTCVLLFQIGTMCWMFRFDIFCIYFPVILPIPSAKYLDRYCVFVNCRARHVEQNFFCVSPGHFDLASHINIATVFIDFSDGNRKSINVTAEANSLHSQNCEHILTYLMCIGIHYTYESIILLLQIYNRQSLYNSHTNTSIFFLH